MPAGFLSNNELMTCLFIFFSKGCQGFFSEKINNFTVSIGFHLSILISIENFVKKNQRKFVKKFVDSKFVKICDEVDIIPGLKYSFLTNDVHLGSYNYLTISQPKKMWVVIIVNGI